MRHDRAKMRAEILALLDVTVHTTSSLRQHITQRVSSQVIGSLLQGMKEQGLLEARQVSSRKTRYENVWDLTAEGKRIANNVLENPEHS